MRNFIKAAALVSFLVPAISFADAPKSAPAAGAGSDVAPKSDAKTDAKAPAKATPKAKKDAGAAKKDATPAAPATK